MLPDNHFHTKLCMKLIAPNMCIFNTLPLHSPSVDCHIHFQLLDWCLGGAGWYMSFCVVLHSPLFWLRYPLCMEHIAISLVYLYGMHSAPNQCIPCIQLIIIFCYIHFRVFDRGSGWFIWLMPISFGVVYLVHFFIHTSKQILIEWPLQYTQCGSNRNCDRPHVSGNNKVA